MSQNYDNRDSIDFGRTNIPKLFARLLIPTLLGLMFNSLLNIADGIFVGKGVGSDALASVNICMPVFTISTSISLLFATGVSVVAQIHLSHRNTKAANINITQALTTSVSIMAVIVLFINVFAHDLCYAFGGSGRLEPYVVTYMRYVSPTMLTMVVAIVGMFVIRLDGSPNYAMLTNAIPAVANIILDYIMVFPMDMGIKGAALATSIAQSISVVMVLYYFMRKTNKISLYKPKFSKKSIRLTLRNLGYMTKLGFPTFVGEIALSIVAITGNFMFMSRLNEDGVAAFAVACYLLPIIFMFGNAIGQTMLPIVSFNHGLKDKERIRQTFRLSVFLTLISASALSVMGILFNEEIVVLFLDYGTNAFLIAASGMKLYSLGFLFISLNIVMIMFLQSVELSRQSLLFMSLRGIIFVVPLFMLLPCMIGDSGLWLSIPISEMLTAAIIASYITAKRKTLF